MSGLLGSGRGSGEELPTSGLDTDAADGTLGSTAWNCAGSGGQNLVQGAGAGPAVAALSGYCIGPPRYGLVIGFAEADAARVRRFCDALARALEARAA